MIRRTRTIRRETPLLAHVTTTDISLALLLGPQLEAFGKAGYEVVGLSGPGPFVPEIEALGARHVTLRNSTRSKSVRADLRAAWELWTWIRNERPDIVHTHNPKPGVYGRIAAALAGVPLVVNTVHGLYATPDDRLVKRMAVYSLERLAAAFSDAELVQNPEDLATLRRLRVPAAKLHLLGNGIDLCRFSPESVDPHVRARIRQELGAADDTVVVTAVGRLVREKGYQELFAAAADVVGSNPKVIFAIAGPIEPTKDDALTEDELRSAEKSGIRLLGHRTDVEAIYAASDLYVLASHREGFPRSAMEASAMGLPVVASDIRGCRQVVEHGRTGLLVPVRDPDSLAQAILSLAGDPFRRSEMGTNGRSKAEREFDQSEVIERTLGVYRRVDRLQP